MTLRAAERAEPPLQERAVLKKNGWTLCSTPKLVLECNTEGECTDMILFYFLVTALKLGWIIIWVVMLDAIQLNTERWLPGSTHPTQASNKER